MTGCRIELVYMDPDTYTAISTHEMRQAILIKMYTESYNGRSMTKQELADSLGIKYQQLVYQLTNHLSDFWTVIKEDFSGLSKEQRAAAANPMFQSSTFTFGPVKAGTKVEAVFEGSNIGKGELVIYKAESDSRRISVTPPAPLKPGAKGTVKAVLDTKGMASGEALFIVTLTTKSPLRPIVNLYITGFIK